MLHSTYNTFEAAVASAVSAATPAGHTARTQVVPSLGDMTAEELKRHVAGAVLQLDDDSFAFVPMHSSVVTLSSGEVQISVKQGDGAARRQPASWLIANNNNNNNKFVVVDRQR